jgi:hypothetical protein
VRVSHSRSDEASLVRKDDGLYAVAEVQLGEDARHMSLDRALADEECARNFGIREAARQVFEDDAFSIGEVGNGGRRTGARSGSGQQPIDDPARDLRTQQGIAGGDCAYCFYESFW